MVHSRANTKTRTEHRLPLTAQVSALLSRYRAIQQARGYEGVYLFPNRRGLPLSETQASMVFTRLGQGEWTSHDLRKVSAPPGPTSASTATSARCC